MPAALRGAVIIGTRPEWKEVTYRKKCERCGWVDHSTVTTGVGTGGVLTSGFNCPNCRQSQTIEITGF